MFPVLEMCEIQASWQTVVDDVGLNAVRRWLITSMLIFYGKLWDRKWSRNSQSKQISLPYLQNKESCWVICLDFVAVIGDSHQQIEKLFFLWKVKKTQHDGFSHWNEFLCNIYKAKKFVGESVRILFFCFKRSWIK